MEASLFQQLKNGPLQHLQHVVVGGHAVNSYGYLRSTLDADFMVPESNLESWKEALGKQGYHRIHESEGFCQFSAAEEADALPVDLIVVTDSTFASITKTQQIRSIAGVELPVPEPLHLIALKIHAMRSERRFRDGKDLGDVVELLRRCKISLTDPEFAEILNRYGNERIRTQIQQRLEES